MDDAELEDHVEVAAPPARVWSLVSDLRRMADWSPQVTSTRFASPDAPGVGSRFTNRNRHGDLEWTTHGEIVRFAPGRELAFRIEENGVIWSFTLDPAPDGRTRVTERRETPDGISARSRELTDAYLGGQEVFTATQRAGMRETLDALRAEAEGSGSSEPEHRAGSSTLGP